MDTPTVTLDNGVDDAAARLRRLSVADLEECERSVVDALQAGYRLHRYGGVIRQRRSCRPSDQAQRRPATTSSSPLSCGWPTPVTTAPKQAFERSLERLQLDYIDLYLIHQPFGDVYGAWRAMEALYQEGRIRAIGVSNFHPDRVMDFIVHTGGGPAVNQIETHPFHQQVEAQTPSCRRTTSSTSPGARSPKARTTSSTTRCWLEIAATARQDASPRSSCAGSPSAASWPSPSRFARSASTRTSNVFDFELTTRDMTRIAPLDTGTSAFFDHRDPAAVKRLGEAVRRT